MKALLLLMILISAQSFSQTNLYVNSVNSPLLPLISTARTSIDIEIYELSDHRIMREIINAMNRGVKVRIIQEPTTVGATCYPFSPKSTQDTPECQIQKTFMSDVLSRRGVYMPFSKLLCGNGSNRCFEHGKLMLVDHQIAMISTGNFSPTSLCDVAQNPLNCNRDYTVTNTNPAVVNALGTIFESDLVGTSYDVQAVLNKYGVQNFLTVSPISRAPLLGFINAAKKSIVIENQYLKDPEMNQALISAALRGVKIDVLVASLCSFVNSPSQLNPKDVQIWQSIYSGFEKAGISARVFTRSVLVNGHSGYLHAKTIIVDGTWAWVGSINGSVTAISSNREFGVFFNDMKSVSNLGSVMRADFLNPNAVSWQDAVNCKNDFN